MEKKVMNREVAEKTLEDWFDIRRIKKARRNSPNELTGIDDNRERMIEGFEYGELILEDQELKQKLFEPIKGPNESIIEQLVWKPRVIQSELDKWTVGIKQNDGLGYVRANIAAATGINRDRLGGMTTDDYSLASTIVQYFL